MHLRVLLLCVISAYYSEASWTAAPEDEELDGFIRQVHIVFRHGHKEPKVEFPNDPNAYSPIWKNGPGQLSVLGRQQAYLFGQDLRSRYKRLLPENRAWKVVKTFSSDVRRTLMTAAVVLAGLLPPSIEDRWADIPWQPAPIHTKPQYVDNTLASHLNCPRYKLLFAEQATSASKETEWLYDYVGKHSGRKINSPETLTDLYTCLDIQQQAGLRIPLWSSRIYQTMKLESAKDLLRSTRTSELARFRTGPLLEKLTDFNGTNIAYPLVLYSTHDTVISGLLGVFRVNVTEPPNYTAAVVIEHREVHGQYHVQLWYRSRAEEPLVRYSWPGCGERCPLSKIREFVHPFLFKSWVLECEEQELDIISSLLFAFSAFGIVTTLCLCIYKPSYKAYELIR